MSRSPIYLLDTNTVSYILNGRSEAARQIFRFEKTNGLIAVSAITQAETLFGLEQKTGATRYREAVQDFFSIVQIFPWDHNVAPTYGKLRAQLAAKGISLAGLDMLLAAHALHLDAILVTADKAFAHASPPLQTVNWATDL